MVAAGFLCEPILTFWNSRVTQLIRKLEHVNIQQIIDVKNKGKGVIQQNYFNGQGVFVQREPLAKLECGA
jgi:hypothetical protein